MLKNRYLKFLYLVKKYPYTSICPTYDIDEMWHLHILFFARKKCRVLQYINSFIPHKNSI
ncbi:glycine-rich domain-containing protein-like [Heyndrickxia coagulans]|uniref:glycine-rich domain-containing protein-like n=1 Tax=Heyndrickxia coagulans TaxID=1398 RepID=UPI001452264C|nr:glycine-rich domain-containing protein-like [Heyndrickxia coagulans]